MTEQFTLGHLFAAAGTRYGDERGLTDDATSLTYAEAAREVHELHEAIASIDNKPVVASVLDNSCLAVLLFAAISAAGGVNVCLEPRMRPEDMERAIELSQPDVVVFGTDRPGALIAADRIPAALVVDPDTSLAWQLRDAVMRTQRRARGPSLPAGAVLFTSGSTGVPKGVIKTEEALRWNIIESSTWSRRSGKQCELFAIPLGHLNFWDIAMPAYWTGGGVRLVKEFSPSEFLAISEQTGPSSTCITPGMMARLLDAGADRQSVPTLKSVILWGDLSDELREEMLDSCGEIFRFCYGITEGSSFAATTEEFVTHPGACGVPVCYCSIEIRDEADRPLPRGEVGGMWQHTPTAFSGYIGGADPGKEAIPETSWFRTGDLAHLDLQGRVYMHARETLTIKTGGLNVYPFDVESVCAGHRSVRACVVVGVPDRTWGEAVVAVIEPRDGVTVDPVDVITFCRERLSGYQCPKRVVVTPRLPLMPNGKFDRRAIIAEVAADSQPSMAEGVSERRA